MNEIMVAKLRELDREVETRNKLLEKTMKDIDFLLSLRKIDVEAIEKAILYLEADVDAAEGMYSPDELAQAALYLVADLAPLKDTIGRLKKMVPSNPGGCT